jgi:hypothetical protein
MNQPPNNLPATPEDGAEEGKGKSKKKISPLTTFLLFAAILDMDLTAADPEIKLKVDERDF